MADSASNDRWAGLERNYTRTFDYGRHLRRFCRRMDQIIILGPAQLFLTGATAAFVVTYFTFLPSFLFILAGVPLVESTHDNLKYTAPLTGITASVVGVIVNLAAFFAYHVFWPQDFAGHFDGIGAVIGLSALLALLRYKVGVIPVIAACGALGLLFIFVKPWLERQVFPHEFILYPLLTK